MRPFVVGLGSHHGDDQAGWLVLDRLRERGYPESRLARLQHPVDLLDVITVDDSLWICDACAGAGVPGTIRCFAWPTDKLVYQRPSGSHDLTLCDVMELGRQLGSVPKAAQIWTLEGNSWSAAAEPSAAVQLASVQVADAIWKGVHDA